MHRYLGVLVIAVALDAAPCYGQESEKARPEQLKDLMREYQGLLDAFDKALLEIKGNAQRDAFVEKSYSRPERFYARFMALAAKHSKDAVAAGALIWVVTHSSPDPQGRGIWSGRSNMQAVGDALSAVEVARSALGMAVCG